MKVYKNLESYSDVRGVLKNILPDGVNIKSALFISSKAGTQRGNHWHKEDEHYAYILKGKVTYEYVGQGDNNVKFINLKPGDVIHTPIIERHRYKFETDGEMIILSIRPRSQEEYEKDTTRENF